MKNRFEGFSKLTPTERERRLIQLGIVNPEEMATLKKEGGLPFDLANRFVENAVGSFPLPLGLALNFVIDGEEKIIPMAVEETSVIAGASKTAKWIRDSGEIVTRTLSKLGIGQIQFPILNDKDHFCYMVQQHQNEWVQQVNQFVLQDIVSRGGGAKSLEIRLLPRPNGAIMGVLHLLVDTCDAMGANSINQACEFLVKPIEAVTGEKVGMCILSNLADTRLTQAEVVIRNIDPELGNAIAEGSLFAQLDPHRAATNNKGVMNGIDAVMLATGNDWRALEAGVHAYAAQSGRYTSITRWEMVDGNLRGVLTAPLLVGTVGGVTRLHPVAKICLKILNVKSGAELARIAAAVGLVQNLAAISALVTKGISYGHMKLHIANLALSSGASEAEMPILTQRLVDRLEQKGRIVESDVKEVLAEIRQQPAENVILVNPDDHPIGEMEKIKAHQFAMLHRAFSVFIFRRKKGKLELLLQQRSLEKYHCPGLWTNTTCSHPTAGQTMVECAQKRLREEMGFTVPLQECGKFHYVATFDNGLAENEIDHVLIGFYDQETVPLNPAEAAAAKWVEVEQLQIDVKAYPDRYTPWLARALTVALQGLRE